MTDYYQNSLKKLHLFEEKINNIINEIYNKNDSKYHYSINYHFIEDVLNTLKSEKEFMNLDFTMDKNHYINCKSKNNNNDFYLSEIIFCIIFDSESFQKVPKCLFECIGFKKIINDFHISYVFSSQQNEVYIDSEINDFYSVLLISNSSTPYLKAHNYAGLSYLRSGNAKTPVATPKSKEIKQILNFISNIYTISLKDLNIIEKFLFEQVFLSQEERDSFYLINDIYFFEDTYHEYTMNIHNINFKTDCYPIN